MSWIDSQSINKVVHDVAVVGCSHHIFNKTERFQLGIPLDIFI